jgi:predicted SAM-dependent methyltransferase
MPQHTKFSKMLKYPTDRSSAEHNIYVLNTVIGDIYDALYNQKLIEPRFCVMCSKNVNIFTPHLFKHHVKADETVVHPSPELRCPISGAFSRTRLQYYTIRAYLTRMKNKSGDDAKQKILHFAPERMITKKFRERANEFDYVAVDIDATVEGIDHTDDLCKISYGDETFDCVIASHVLEHVDDDTAAMNEVFRVLKPGGFAILDVPIDFLSPITICDPAYNTDELREKHYGYYQHVRQYGLDYYDKLRSVGFDVTTISHKEAQELWGLSLDKHGFNYLPVTVCCKK